MRPSDGAISLWPLAVIGFIVVLAAASVTPVARLNTKAPKDFQDLRATAKGPNAAEAQRYWDTAVNVIQWRYDHTAALPTQPPAEFAPGDGRSANAARQAYWAKLREEWLQADNWHKTVTVNITWILNDVQAVWRGVRDWAVDHT